MPDTAVKKMVVEGVAEHPAMRAWCTLYPERASGAGIEILKGRKATARRSAYRLVGVGPGGSSVIAKRYPRAKAVVERWVYEEVLPRVRVSAPRFHGCVDAGGSSCWLFLEDAGERRYCTADEEHRRLAGQWLGRLHTVVLPVDESRRASSPAKGSGEGVPGDLGPACWLEHVRSGLRRIEASLGNAALSGKNRGVLGEVLRLLARIEQGWDRVEARCRAMPRTLVHGDFVAKNIGVRAEDGRVELLPFDWGQAGWGPPAVDLGACPPALGGLTANVDVTAYWDAVRGHWPGVDLGAVQDWVAVGTLARCVMAVDWEAASLGSAYVTESVARMGLYRDALGEILEAGEFA